MSSKDSSCPEDCHMDAEDLFGRNCQKCGIAPSFADDCTVVVARRNPEENKTLLKEKLENITIFLESNKLCINKSKTKVQNFMVKQRRAKNIYNETVMTVQSEDGDKDINNQMHTRWLGLNLHQDLSWRSHLELGSKPLLPTLRRRLGALQHLGKSIPRRGRLALATGLLLSKIIYMIPVWGGTHLVHINKVQKILNKAARFVNNGGWRWNSIRLMESCKWMTAKELVTYHSLITVWKLVNHQVPSQLSEHFEVDDDRKLSTNIPRLQITSS